MTDMTFGNVIPTEEQENELYALLLRRKHTISHCSHPSIEEHLSFVRSHPYRVWCITYLGAEAVGSFYVSNDNTIGINLIDVDDVRHVTAIIRYVKENFTPLPAIRSVRSDIFTINVPPANTALLESLNEIGAEVLQITYSLKRVDSLN